jgi:formate--tetrahydrofolate ligase
MRRPTPRPILEVAADAGLLPGEVETFGPAVAKVRLEALARLRERPQGKYILVTAMTPTPMGEGKTVTTIGLGLGMAATGRSAMVCLRQPSLGPLLGVKGGGAGGGAARLEPYDHISVHLTGDLHAVGIAHNLLAAMADEALRRGRHDLSAERMQITRVLDMNDRVLRRVRIGIGSKAERDARFESTAASEVMAILALTEGLDDLQARCGRMRVGLRGDGTPVTAEDLGVAGAMAAMLRDAVKPNLVQTAEGTPVLCHAGPFANIAHGNSSILADRVGLGLADYVITEAGFGADMGAEKFFNIKCRAAGFQPALAVMVATCRALRFHGRGEPVKAGHPLPDELQRPNPAWVEAGCANLARQIANVQTHGVPVVVAINRFPDDDPAELAAVQAAALAAGAKAVVESTGFAEGGAGTVALADAVAEHATDGSGFAPLYSLEESLDAKIDAIARRVYGASGVSYEPAAQAVLDRLAGSPTGQLPVCMAKTQYSLSHDATALNAAKGFTLPIKELRESDGAGFVVARCGNIFTMPGLPANPRALDVRPGANGEILGI